jgi:plastocyanin
MGGTPPDWRVQVQAGDKVSVHATYDTRRADWYEVMGIMPVAVYDKTDVGGVDAQNPALSQTQGVLTHGHLSENDNHGGSPTGAPDPFSLPSAPAPNNTIGIQSFAYRGDPSAGPSVPTIEPGQTLTFRNYDAVPSVNAFHTITACKEPCTGSTGIAYPIANGPVTFDSGELGFNGNNGGIRGEPAADRDSWQTPQDLPSGTYTYFCRIHPFMRGAFRVETFLKLRAKKKQRIANSAVSVTLNRPGKVRIRARVKGAKQKAGRSSALAVLSRALDSRRTKSVPANVKTKIRLKFARAARERITAAIARKGPMKVVVTSKATDRFGKTSTAQASFRLIG